MKDSNFCRENFCREHKNKEKYMLWNLRRIPFIFSITILFLIYIATFSYSYGENSDSYGENSDLAELRIRTEVRLRNEFWSTFQKDIGGDNPYNFILARIRNKFDIAFGNLNFRLASQGVKALFLPRDARFGSGKTYYEQNDKKNFPGDLHLVELNVGGKIWKLDFSLGRIGIKDGADITYEKNEKFNSLKMWRVSERLIGELDWTNAGRKFDGGTLGYDLGFSKISIFGARALGGGVDFDDGYKWLDVYITGGSFTIKKDTLGGIELGAYNILYYDTRKFDGKNKDIAIQTSGLRAVSIQELGPGELDFVLWGAYQFGKFIGLNQNAFALIGEVGYQFSEIMLKPWLRIGIAYASGDANPQDQTHKTFFNLLPANHKWYGYMDKIAFSNLRNIYIQNIFTIDIFEFVIDFHIFSLNSSSDSWYTGSGAFNNKTLGYSTTVTATRVSDIGSPDLGNEIDLTLVVRYSSKFWFDIGYSRFFGGKIIKQEFPKKSNADWFYTRLNFTF